MIKAHINNIDCILFYDKRVSSGQPPVGYLNMYNVRHDECDWTRPISIEKFVFVNFFGTIFTKETLELDINAYIEIKSFKTELKYIKFKIRRKLFERILNL